MRKALFLILGLFLAQGMGFAYDEGSAVHNVEQSQGTAAEPVRVYMLVRYGAGEANTPSISAGEVVFWDVISDDGVTINRLSVAGVNTGAVSTDAVAGVAVGSILTSDNAGTAATSVGGRNWGWIQTYGQCSAVMVKASVNAGQTLAAADTLIHGQYAIGVTGLNGANKVGSVFGFALDAASADGSVEAFIKNR